MYNQTGSAWTLVKTWLCVSFVFPEKTLFSTMLCS